MKFRNLVLLTIYRPKRKFMSFIPITYPNSRVHPNIKAFFPSTNHPADLSEPNGTIFWPVQPTNLSRLSTIPYWSICPSRFCIPPILPSLPPIKLTMFQKLFTAVVPIAWPIPPQGPLNDPPVIPFRLSRLPEILIQRPYNGFRCIFRELSAIPSRSAKHWRPTSFVIDPPVFLWTG